VSQENEENDKKYQSSELLARELIMKCLEYIAD